MTRVELLEYICFTNYTNECSAVDGRYNCQDCKDAINPLLDEYDKQIKADAIDEFIEWFLNDCYLMLCEETKKEVASSFMRLKEQNK